MKDKLFFTVGPSPIYPQVPQWTQEYFELGYGSISHRSEAFQSMYEKMDIQLRKLMLVPASHAILIASSGSEIMERILQNCVKKSSFHFVNGAFSKKFYDYSLRLGLDAQKYEIEFGLGFETIPEISENAELICVTHNETSTGIKTSEEYIHSIKSSYPDKILAVDTVSSAPFVNLDFNLVDICFFSSQKAFGLPAGLGIWIIRRDLAENLVEKNISKDKAAHNTLSDYLKHYPNFQTPSTPNTLGVFLMGKVAENMNIQGRESLFETLIMKRQMFRKIFETNEYLYSNFSSVSSDTVIAANCLQEKEKINQLLLDHNIICSSGYGSFKDTQIRFSNFPANSIQDIECLGRVLGSR